MVEDVANEEPIQLHFIPALAHLFTNALTRSDTPHEPYI